jgi:glyoxylase-like metal-dependent hydrolase (beta-lactamase superfamily II)
MVEFAVVRTSQSTSRQGLVFAGGSYLRPVDIAFSAFLVRHGDDSFLFDSGLGLRVDEQYGTEMPRWKRPLIWYGEVDAVKTQLERAGIAPPPRIVLSHGHWDHASALVDFPQAEVWTTPAERDFLKHAHDCGPLRRGAVMLSQVSSPSIRWHEFAFEPKPFRNFEASLDLYGDGTVVLVPLAGHTPGSIGMFLTVDSGRRFLFCGDTVWNANAIPKARPKTFLARAMVDSDAVETQRAVNRLRDALVADPELTIIPAHDAAVQDRLGLFPAFVR